MAIAFDAVGTASTKTATPWSTSGSHTAVNGAADTVVLVCVTFGGTATITPANAARSVTFGGVACEFVGYSYIGSGLNGGFNAFYALFGPPTGAQTVAVTVTPTTGGPVILRTNTVSYTGVGAIGEIFSSAGSSTAPSVTCVSAVGRVLVHLGFVASTTLTGYSQTARYTNVTTHSTVIGDAAGASSVTFSFTSANQIWGNVVVELIPSPDSGVVRQRSLVEASLTTGSSASLAGSTTVQVNQSDANTKLLAAVVISVSTNSTSTTCAVTCGGTAMTQESFTQYGATTERAAVGIYSLANPGTGTKTVTATSGGTSTKTQIAVGGVCYTGAGVISAAVTAAALALAVSSQVNGRAFYCGANGAAITTPTLTERFLNGGTPAGCGDYILVQDSAGATTVSFSASGTATTPQSAGVSIAPVAAGFTGTVAATAQKATAAFSGVMQPAGTITSQVGGVGGYEAEIDFSTKGTAAMPSVMDTGQAIVATFSPNSTANPIIVSGRYVEQFVSTGTGAGYLTTDQALVSGEITYMQTTFKKTGAGATDSWVVGLVAWTQRFPVGALITGAVDSPCHLGFNNGGWNYGWYDATLGLTNIQSRTYSPGIDHTVDHTVSVLIDKANSQATVTGADGVAVVVSDSHIGSKVGNYACCEIYYGAGDTDKRPEVSSFKATSRAAGAKEPGRTTASLSGTVAAVTGAVAAGAQKTVASVTGVMQPSGTVAAALQRAVAALTGGQEHTGTVAATLQKSVASLAGTQEQTGTIAATLQRAVAAMTGGQEHTGTIAAVMQRAVAALAGTQEQTGTISATFQRAVAGLTGVMQPTGTVAATFQKAVAALVGTQEQTGTIAAALQRATATLAGIMQPAGTVTAAFQAAVASAVGAQEYTGTIGAALQRATATLVGSLDQPGTVTGLLQKTTAVLVGAQEQTGTVAATLQKAVASVVVTQEYTSTVTAALQKATAAAAGTQEYTGTVAAALQKTAADFQLLMQPTGTVDGALRPSTVIMTSGLISAGPLAVDIQHLTYVGLGTQEQAGAVAVALQKPVGALAGVMQPAGTVVAVLQRTAALLISSQTASGAVAAALRPAVFSGAGANIVTGVVAASMRPLLAALTGLGPQTLVATMSAAMRAPLIAAVGAQQQQGAIAAVLLAPWFSNLGEYQMAWGQGAGTYRVYDNVSMTDGVGLLFSFHLVPGSGPGSGPHLYLNGAEIVPAGDNGMAAAVPNVGADVLLGGRNTQDRGMDGWIGEMVLYDHAVTAAERAQVEDYLKAKWNL